MKVAVLAAGVLVLAALLMAEAAPAGELLDRALDGPMAGVEELVFAVRAPGQDGHWYANFGYWASDENRMMYGPGGGRLCRLNLRSGRVHILLDDPGGGVRDPQVHYDGKKILFSYRKGGSKHYHLYEIDADGAGLRQLTDGPFDDIEPIYLPDGDILFCSSRCKRWVNCWNTQVAVRYRCDAQGRNIRILSSNIEQDNTPWMLPDGRILYMRWEYVDRSRVKYHHLWTSNPDGTGEMVYFGNQHPGTVMLDAKPIPGTEKVAAIFSPGHGRKEHAGAVTIVDAKAGPDEQSHARRIGSGSNYRDVYPFSEHCFLAADESRLLLMDGRGRTEVIYTLSNGAGKFWCHEPRPLRPRPRERVIPPRADPKCRTGRLILADVRRGRNMDGVQPGEIKKLLVLETLPKPINHSGVMEPISLVGTFTLPRILGTVPVEPDGSAFLEAPALRSLFFVALDENDLSVKRMQSFVSVMPGETTGCVGCHENRTRSVEPTSHGSLLALRRPASKIRPVAEVPDVMDFPRDIQPILDEHCVKCHGYPKRPAADLPLTGARGPWYSHSYYALMSRGYVAHGLDGHGDYPPRAIGSSASRLMKLIDPSHYGVKLSAGERAVVRLWIESGAPYAGTYASLGTGMIQLRPPVELLRRRCGGCHRLDKGSSGFAGRADAGLLFNVVNPNRSPFLLAQLADRFALGPPRRYDAQLLYNLSDPPRSPILLAPLSRQAGGWGLCKDERFDTRPKPPGAKHAPAAVVFASTGDPDYGRLLADIEAAKMELETIKRFDMPGFRPSRHYIREMQRFGVLPADLGPNDPIDPYATDRAYWKSLWHRPPTD